jgi:Na+-transporting NADH:ubiquinone oxidoreductase subunit NqrC
MQKGGAQNEYQVDAITGGTKTCDGVNAMLATSIGKYASFLLGAEVAEEECCCGECCEAEANVESNNVEEE